MSKESASIPIGLTDLIYQVKRDLLSAARAADPMPLYAVEEIEIEIGVSVSRSAQGGVNIQVIALGAERTRDDTQIVRVLLKPLCGREQLLDYLQKANPEEFGQILDESKKTLKGGAESTAPLGWP